MHVRKTAKSSKRLLSYSTKRVSMSAVLIKVQIALYNTFGIASLHSTATLKTVQQCICAVAGRVSLSWVGLNQVVK